MLGQVHVTQERMTAVRRVGERLVLDPDFGCLFGFLGGRCDLGAQLCGFGIAELDVSQLGAPGVDLLGVLAERFEVLVLGGGQVSGFVSCGVADRRHGVGNLGTLLDELVEEVHVILLVRAGGVVLGVPRVPARPAAHGAAQHYKY